MDEATSSSRGAPGGGWGSKFSKRTKFWILASLFGIFLVVAVSAATIKLTASNEFCVMCHEMDSYMTTYNHSSHKDVAGCNDCHTDQSNVVEKLWSKGTQGVRHGFVKAIGAPEHIFLSRQWSYDTVQENCLRCHNDLINDTSKNGGKYCFECHKYTPHGKIY